MTIDVFSATGQKSGTMELPKDLFEATINRGLIHQVLVRQQSNRRRAVAHAKGRSEVQGSTRKLYAQKHTGRARRGSVRSPLLRGGGKAFGPKKDRNFEKDMPKAMRRAALFACLSLKAKAGAIIGLEAYPDAVKTKDAVVLLKKLPVEFGRRIVLVTPGAHRALQLSCRNLPNVKTLHAAYLNPEDILASKHLIFLGGAVEKAVEVFAKRGTKVRVHEEAPKAVEEKSTKKTKTTKSTKKPVKKATVKKASPPPSL